MSTAFVFLLIIHHCFQKKSHSGYFFIRQKRLGMNFPSTLNHFSLFKLLFFVIKHAMTVALVVFISYLLSEFAAHTLILIASFKLARTISSGSFKTVLYHINYLLIIIKSYFHYLYSSIIFCSLSFVTYPTDKSRNVLSFINATVGML